MKPENVLILPGWQNSGPEHWQSRWEILHGDERVEQDAERDRRLRETLEALQAHLDALVIVGAQAIYLHGIDAGGAR